MFIGEEDYEVLIKSDIGDIVGIEGTVFCYKIQVNFSVKQQNIFT